MQPALRMLLLVLICWATDVMAVDASRFEWDKTHNGIAKLLFDRYQLRALKGMDFIFPYDAIMEGQAGCVIVQFDVGINGLPDNYVILNSKPKDVADKYALVIVNEWTFEPIDHPKTVVIPVNF